MFPKNRLFGRRISPGKKWEEDIYSKERRNQLLEDGAITNEEEGFMRGYLEDDFDDENIDEEDFNKHDIPYFEGMF